MRKTPACIITISTYYDIQGTVGSADEHEGYVHAPAAGTLSCTHLMCGRGGNLPEWEGRGGLLDLESSEYVRERPIWQARSSAGHASIAFT